MVYISTPDIYCIIYIVIIHNKPHHVAVVVCVRSPLYLRIHLGRSALHTETHIPLLQEAANFTLFWFCSIGTQLLLIFFMLLSLLLIFCDLKCCETNCQSFRCEGENFLTKITRLQPVKA